MSHLGTLALDFADAQGANNRRFSWEEMGPGWVDGQEVAVHLAEVFALSMPANVEVVAGDGSLSVSWRVVTDADGYKVQWKSGSEQYDGSRERTVQTNQASIGGLEDGTPYTIRVRGTNAGGVGKWSDEVTGVPRRADGPPPRPGGGRRPNRPPEAVETLADRSLTVGASPVSVDLASAFRDADDDALTYAASSSAEDVATVAVAGSVVTVTPVGAGDGGRHGDGG